MQLECDLQQKVEELRRKRGAAALDCSGGLDRLTAEIAAAEAQLEVHGEAFAEKNRREREAAEEAQRLARERLREELLQREQERLEAVSRAEKAARELAESLKQALAIAKEEARVAGILDGSPPLSISGREFEHRLSGRLSAVLATVLNQHAAHHFGRIDLWQMPFAFAEDSWAVKEGREMERVIKSHSKGLN